MTQTEGHLFDASFAQVGCHALDVTFDDHRLISDGGLILPATLAQHLGLRELFDECVNLGDTAGRANVGHKAMTVVHSLLAGGDCIDDIDVLRSGSSELVLGHAVLAPSTIGTFLRSFSFGHARQLDRVLGDLLARAWAVGAGPGDEPTTSDVDSTICETYGLAKQGGRFWHTRVRGYHPLIAHIAGTGDVVGVRQRGGNAHSGRGAKSFETETINRVRAAGASGPLVLRADSGFYSANTVNACRNNSVAFSVTIKAYKSLRETFAALPAEQWTPIPYWFEGGADVAETTYKPFGEKQEVRLIVRRVWPNPGTQLALFVEYSYHAFITDRDGDTLELEADHRRHAVIEDTIRDLTYGVGLNHMPSGRFGANAAWLALNAIAHNLARWTHRLGLGETDRHQDTPASLPHRLRPGHHKRTQANRPLPRTAHR